jgi:trans-aconitate 2-methyltransferase
VTLPGDGWDPAQYHRFDAERDRPFHDLLALLQPVEQPALVDLGCGDGRLTVLAHERLGAATTLGIDSSPAMLDKAPVVDRVRFERGDIAEWTEPESADVILANASLHWVPDHESVLARWRASLRPGGQLLANLPANADHPSHLVLAEVTDELGIDADLDPVAANVLLPEAYADVLDRLGSDDQHVRLQVYAHHLTASSEVVEWVKGTTMTRVRRATDDAGYEHFLDVYRRRLLDAIGDRAPYTYLFKRILFWARFP